MILGFNRFTAVPCGWCALWWVQLFSQSMLWEYISSLTTLQYASELVNQFSADRYILSFVAYCFNQWNCACWFIEAFICYLFIKLDRTQFLQLPLPHLKIGYLTAPPAGKPIAPHNDWKRSEFLLNHERLQQVRYDWITIWNPCICHWISFWITGDL